MSRFKVEDEVVVVLADVPFTHDFKPIGTKATVTEVTSDGYELIINGILQYLITKDAHKYLELQEIWNSPLYKAMKEEE